MNKEQAVKITGGLTITTKMPCPSFSLPAQKCVVGSRLRKVEGTVCSICYAMKGNYVRFPAIYKAMLKRYKKLEHPLWIEAMAYLIEPYRFFRWHDSGDLKDIRHLGRIVAVAKLTPGTKHWLPTREYGVVADYIDLGNTIPKNLKIRLSAIMINGPTNDGLAKRLNVGVSGVGSDTYDCPAADQDGQCLSCRLCWSNKFKITYKKH